MKPWFYHHSHQFLQKQFASVRNFHLANILTRLAQTTVVLELVQVCLAEKTALRTNVNSVAITNVEKSFLQEPSSTVTYHAIALHLSET